LDNSEKDVKTIVFLDKIADIKNDIKYLRK